MKIIAVIPARGNSKRILNKNLLKINNQYILKILYQNLKNMNIFQSIVLSTDSIKIKKLAKKIGYDFVIDRPKSLSNDNSTTNAVVTHSIDIFKKKIKFTHVCCVYPMAILFKKRDLINAKKILKGDNEIVFPALKYSHPIQRAFRIKKDSKIKYKLSKKNLSKKTQYFSDYYHDAGQFYLGHVSAWKNYSSSKKKCIKLPLIRAIDVDNYEEFELLKSKFFYIKNKII